MINSLNVLILIIYEIVSISCKFKQNNCQFSSTFKRNWLADITIFMINTINKYLIILAIDWLNNFQLFLNQKFSSLTRSNNKSYELYIYSCMIVLMFYWWIWIERLENHCLLVITRLVMFYSFGLSIHWYF